MKMKLDCTLYPTNGILGMPDFDPLLLFRRKHLIFKVYEVKVSLYGISNCLHELMVCF